MANRAKFWSPIPEWGNVIVERADAKITTLEVRGSMWLISGDLSAFFTSWNVIRAHGPRDLGDGKQYVLRLAPDRVLAVNCAAEPKSQLLFGWNMEGFAVTDVTAGFILMDITGAAADEVMERGASYDWSSREFRPQESSTMMFADMRVAVARLASGWRLHVERPNAPALWRWLENI